MSFPSVKLIFMLKRFVAQIIPNKENMFENPSKANFISDGWLFPKVIFEAIILEVQEMIRNISNENINKLSIITDLM